LFSAAGDRPTVLRANATTTQGIPNYFLGIAAHDISAGATGFILNRGILPGLNTLGYTAGATIYVGAASGSITTTKPAAPTASILIGTVVKVNATDGGIFVQSANPNFISTVSDVSSSFPAANNDLLVFRTGSSTWINTKSELDLGGSFSGSFSGQFSGSSLMIASASCNSFVSSSFPWLRPSVQINKSRAITADSPSILRSSGLANALTLNSCVSGALSPGTYYGVEQQYWAQRVQSGSEDAGWGNLTRIVGRQQYYWENTGSYLSSFRNYLSANDPIGGSDDAVSRAYPASEFTSYSNLEFFDLQQYQTAGPRHKWLFFTGEVSSSNAGQFIWNNSKLNGTDITYLSLPNDTSAYVEVKWIGLNDEIGGPYTVLKHDYFVVNKLANEITAIGNINTLYSDLGNIGFDTQYLEDTVNATDVIRLQFRIGYYNGVAYSQAGRNYTMRVKAVVEIVEVNNLQKT
jgi:hypothetical protein